jgi:hypothetical protein
MHGITRHVAILVIALAALCGPPPAVSAGSLEGRWELVEQRYGKGAANQAPREEPVWLEFVQLGERLEASIWVGSSRSQAVAWPALAAEETQLPARVEELATGPLLDRVRAVYTVEPAEGEGTRLEVVESYRLGADGETLEGTVTVSFYRDEKPRGSYVLHRRFERRP